VLIVGSNHSSVEASHRLIRTAHMMSGHLLQLVSSTSDSWSSRVSECLTMLASWSPGSQVDGGCRHPAPPAGLEPAPPDTCPRRSRFPLRDGGMAGPV